MRAGTNTISFVPIGTPPDLPAIPTDESVGYARSSLTGLRADHTATGKLIHDCDDHRRDQGLANAKPWVSRRKGLHGSAGAAAGGM